MTPIVLTLPEIEMALAVGRLRRVSSLQAGHVNAHGYDGVNGWDVDIEGAAAEMAYCKSRGLYFPGVVGNYKGADVGDKVQVRHTVLESGCLILRENDSDNHYYVLVVGKIPQFTIVGWICGKDGKKPEWWKAPNGRPGAWFVPHGALRKFIK